MKEFDAYLKEFEKNVDSHIEATIKEIKDFATKNKITRFVIGMSGGVDCALSSALVKKAGYEVIALTMPYEENTSKQRVKGISDAKKHCLKFDVPIYEVSITNMVNELLREQDKIKDHFNKYNGNEKMAKANLLPRARMMNLYYVAQLVNGVVLGTGNLSEYTMGYFTKWGDGACDINPIAHLTCTEVIELGDYLGLPYDLVHKTPADGLTGKSDEDNLGFTYKELDSLIKKFESPDYYIPVNQKERDMLSMHYNCFHKFNVITLE